jgi:hypothetical protein
MRYGSAAVGGIVASLIGAAVWAAISYFANAEVGYVAWGIGLLAGLGVAMMAKGATDQMTGVIAAVCAVGGVLLGKYVAVYFLVAQAMPADQFVLNDKGMVTQLAWTIAAEREAAGKPIVPGGNKKVEQVDDAAELSADIHDEAHKRWNALPADERQRQMVEQQAAMNVLLNGVADQARNAGFRESFGMFDLLWFGLAVATAFRIGSGTQSS